MIPACLSNPDNTNSTTTSQPSQNLITCIYHTRLCNSPTYLTLTWSKTSSFSHSLTIYAPDSFSLTISLYPPTFFPFFGIRPGSKSIYLTTPHHHYKKIKLYWDFTRAKFADNSAEPADSSFYIAITCNSRVEFLLGDLSDEFARRRFGLVGRHFVVSADPTLLSRREHVFGRRNYYMTRVEFMGSKHEIGIECGGGGGGGGGVLKVKVDGEVRLVVKRLVWKFRGNERIKIGGVEVEFYWDVFNWFNKCGGHHGVFVFQIGDGGVWPEMVGPEKRLMRKSLSSAAAAPLAVSISPSTSCSTVMQWAEESSDGGSRSSCSSSTTGSYASGGGFSFLLYAWRKD